MGDISTKLNYLAGTKTAIKNAIVAKGVSVANTDTFRSYADKIGNITAGSSSTTSLVPNNSGLVFWIDGRYNTRRGKDHTKTYMENLLWANTGCTTASNLEYLRSGTNNSWDGDLLTLGNYAYYPYIYSNYLTVEAVIKVTGTISSPLMIATCGANGGWYLSVTEDNKLRFGARQGSNYVLADTDETLQSDTLYYVVGIFEANNQITAKIVNLGVTKTVASTAALGYSSGYNMGVGTQASSTTSVNGERWAGLKIGMVRVWNRVLSDSEIQANYAESMESFNKVTLTINPTPSDATVTLTSEGYTQSGNSITVPSETEVTYTVSATDYTTQTGTVTVNSSQTLDVILSEYTHGSGEITDRG